MKKKPLWKRVNRGFVVFIGLLVAVTLYVIIQQLMLMPEKRSIADTGYQFAKIYTSAALMTTDEAKALKDEQAIKDKAEELKKQVESLFAADSKYVVTTAEFNTVLQNAVTGMYKYESFGAMKLTSKKITIDQDVAECQLVFDVPSTGEYTDYVKNSSESFTNEVQQVTVGMIFKKVNGAWKIYRISRMDVGGNFYNRR